MNHPAVVTPGTPKRIDEAMLREGLEVLAARDSSLAGIYERLGPPPLWDRAPGFPTLVHIILEQQVSLASARAAFERLLDVASPLTPERMLELSDAKLKAIGFSRQKTRYARLLAEALQGGQLDLISLGDLGDGAARAELVKLKGIGAWTADIYLLMALGRPDIWPAGDLALVKGVQRLKGLESRLDLKAMERIAAPWRPWRAVAARLLWHDYLDRAARKNRAGQAACRAHP